MWSIARKDLQIFLKDRGSVIYLFLMPILFISLFAGLGASASIGAEDEALPLPVVNLDVGGRASQDLLDILEADDRVIVQLYEETEASQLISKAKIQWVLFIPQEFSSDRLNERKTSLNLIQHPNRNQISSGIVEMVVGSAARDMMVADYLTDSLDQLRIMQAYNPDYERYYDEEVVQNQIETQKEQAKERPLVVVEQTTLAASDQEVEADIPNLGQTMAVGFTVLFVFLASQTTAQSIFREKQMGSFRRLMAAPISKATLLGGKLLPNVLTTLVQIVVIFLVMLFLLPVIGVPALNLTSDPLGLILASIAMALCSTSLGILIISFARTESQVGSLAGGILWIAGLIGGTIVPIFLMPDFMKNISRFLPHYWATQAYYGLILRGESLAVVWSDILVLLGFTALFFVIGLWRFEFR